ncbi:unnamed protein product [Rotaria sp. Silwood2]|nr:unnamed protein product [Rotaria sp. Silwood2]CAF4016247.1 unnamed protein product [Rotaria sp. Silwood2]CAF4017237.1 unnamed protein product [Rotaria sp. Silwood2]
MILTQSKMANVDEGTRWIHSDTDLLSGHGYLGSVEVLCSMKSLDFDSRTRVARDSIRLVCTAAGVTLRERRKPDTFSNDQSMISTQANLTHSHTPVQLIISTDALVLKRKNDSQILCSHRMEGISFASAGEYDTKDYIAYVAKDNMNKRACHVLSCEANESLDVITTIGQAFELRYNEYIKTQRQTNEQRGSFKTSDHDRPLLQAERLLTHSGDFLVRESVKIPGQFILSGRCQNQFKHLLLIDPEGVIRTKDYEFDSVQHLISYHKSGKIPIVSADSELLLETPILRVR